VVVFLRHLILNIYILFLRLYTPLCMVCSTSCFVHKLQKVIVDNVVSVTALIEFQPRQRLELDLSLSFLDS